MTKTNQITDRTVNRIAIAGKVCSFGLIVTSLLSLLSKIVLS